MLTRTDGDDDAGRVAGSHDDVVRLGGAVHEVPLPQLPFLAFDDQQRLAREDEKVFLVGFPVVHPDRLTRGQHVETDSDLGELRLALEGDALPTALPVAPAGLPGVQHEPALPGRDEPSVGLLERSLRNDGREVNASPARSGPTPDRGAGF